MKAMMQKQYIFKFIKNWCFYNKYSFPFMLFFFFYYQNFDSSILRVYKNISVGLFGVAK